MIRLLIRCIFTFAVLSAMAQCAPRGFAFLFIQPAVAVPVEPFKDSFPEFWIRAMAALTISLAVTVAVAPAFCSVAALAAFAVAAPFTALRSRIRHDHTGEKRRQDCCRSHYCFHFTASFGCFPVRMYNGEPEKIF
jgi:hypothetical protein